MVNDGVVSFAVEWERVRNVVLKLARGHVAFELDERRRDAPDHVLITPLAALPPESREHFETPPMVSLFPEVGSRAMQRMCVASVTLAAVDDPRRTVELPFPLGPDWLEVQPGRYRYLTAAVDTGETAVRIVLSEFLAGEVVWSRA